MRRGKDSAADMRPDPGMHTALPRCIPTVSYSIASQSLTGSDAPYLPVSIRKQEQLRQQSINPTRIIAAIVEAAHRITHSARANYCIILSKHSIICSITSSNRLPILLSCNHIWLFGCCNRRINQFSFASIVDRETHLPRTQSPPIWNVFIRLHSASSAVHSLFICHSADGRHRIYQRRRLQHSRPVGDQSRWR